MLQLAHGLLIPYARMVYVLYPGKLTAISHKRAADWR